MKLGAKAVLKPPHCWRVCRWPSDFAKRLECATNLMSANRVPVAPPPPVAVGGVYVVTNTLTAEKMFYRLHKP